jgi:hypothetical protein
MGTCTDFVQSHARRHDRAGEDNCRPTQSLSPPSSIGMHRGSGIGRKEGIAMDWRRIAMGLGRVMKDVGRKAA